MSKEIWTAVDKYYQDLVIKPDPGFNAVIQASRDAGLPPIQVTPAQGKFLEALVRFGSAKRVLEIGTLGGYSTAWLARGLPRDGKLISLEVNPEHAAAAEKNLARFDFRERVEIRVGDGRELLKVLAESGSEPFDLIFIDAAKDQYSEYLGWALQLSRPGTLIIADNVVRNGRILDWDSADPSVRGILEFNQIVAEDPRLSATVLQTVSGKGYDGFIFIIVDNREDKA